MLEEHLGYVADRIRREQFQAAIVKTIKAGDRVADLGCGSGILGLLGLQAGAGRVYGIDSTTMIEVARETFSRAGWAERATFIRGHSHRVELPEPVDLVICDHVGYFGFDYGIVHTLQDARRRFLKPSGNLIPSRIRLHLGAVESENYRAKAEGWGAEGVPAEFHWLRQHTVNAKHAVQLPPEAVLGPPARLGDIDLRADHPDFFSWTAELPIERDGIMHGLAGWFECELAEGVWMTNSPLVDRAIQRPQAFLPIDEVVPVQAGDSVKVRIMARPAEHLIAWVVEFLASGQRFSHSTWRGMLLAPEDLLRSQPNRVPRLSREGRARIAVLGYCDGRRTAREIEEAVLRDHPNLFPSPDEISRFVARALGQDTE
ncbi:MAG: methyltransferase domain-containing protein [Candidatus Contendobacter sp.]|nr:methyltransferase domain-containing protein [Candidatus Contendobacter sp.]MDS4057882.1 methyltransferase domain-containing protein [Candidatus Contendobacter sp.]